MIQDIAPHKLNNAYDAAATPCGDSPVVCFCGQEVLVRAEHHAESYFAVSADVSPYGDLSFLPVVSSLPEGTSCRFLFSFDDVPLFLAELNAPVDVPGFEWFGFRDIRHAFVLEKHAFFLLMTALQLRNWYADNVYCGRCGGGTVHHPKERALVCEACGRTIYPRILPAVIVAVLHNGKLLVSKYAPRGGTAYKFYALIAGFTEIGETLEQCVAREVYEETGLLVGNIRYYKSQPWGIVDDLLMGFVCEVEDGAELDENGDPVIRLDETELKKAVFVRPDELELQPDAYSLTNELMLLFKSGHLTSPLDLPLPLDRPSIEALEEEYYR